MNILTIYNVTNYLFSNKLLPAQNDFMEKEIVIKYDTERQQESYRYIKDMPDLPVLLFGIKIGKSFNKMKIIESVDEKTDKIIYEIKPDLKTINKKRLYNADPYSITSVYAIGDICVLGNKPMECVNTILGKTQFDKSCWNELPALKCELIFKCMDLPKEYLNSLLYRENILDPYIYRCVKEEHNSILSSKHYEKGLKCFKDHKGLEKALSKLFGVKINIDRGLGTYYVIHTAQ